MICFADVISATSNLPTFLNASCPAEEISYAMCVDVLYTDGSQDTLLMTRPHKDAPTVLKGTLESDRATKAVVILRDDNNPEATVSAEMTERASAGLRESCA